MPLNELIELVAWMVLSLCTGCFLLGVLGRLLEWMESYKKD